VDKKNKSNNVKLLDCTLRDGGYYTNWDFHPDTVQKYLNAMSHSGVDVIEIGFRSRSTGSFRGAFAYSTDDYLLSLDIPENLTIAVMVNASELLSKDASDYFADASSSPVSIVRVAIHFRDIKNIKPVLSSLAELGYTLTVNLMQVDLLSESDLIWAAKEIDSWGTVDIFYFADSLGNLSPESIKKIANLLAPQWSGLLGLHAHDNKGQALINSITALDAGVSWIDGTILGMGRGAGNARIESLLMELESRNIGSYDAQSLYPLVLKDFSLLQKHYEWGQNIFYYFAAMNGIHPTYVQELLNSDRYSPNEILVSLKYLSGIKAQSYSSSSLDTALQGLPVDGEGSWHPNGWAKGKDVFIIGAGPSTQCYLPAIASYIKSHDNLIVLCLNISHTVPQELASAYVACHQSRILIESHSYAELKCPLIIPLANVPEGIRPLLNGVDVLDYGLAFGGVTIGETGCTLPSALSVAYAISVAIEAGAKRVLMAGFDGYAAGDSRQDEMIEVLEQIQGLPNAIPILAVTPSTYPVAQHSIYEPNL